ncbi:MAG: putative lipoprotein [Leptospiraceae bacterium]|nr:putative lipoprotein [Leptospiraceae bacterium]
MKLSLSILLISILLFSNCQIFDSLGSISTSVNGISTSSNSLSKLSDSVQSISGSFQSISGSSSGGGKKESKLYRMDIRDLTAIYYKTGFDKEFHSDLAQIAQKNGILNWESDSLTYIGIGEGLKKANVNEYEFKTFLKEIEPSRTELRKSLSEGYYSL